MHHVLYHYADYGLWANTRIVRRLEREPESMLDAPAPGSFPSLRAMLLHIRDAEHTWWGRIKGTPTHWPAESDISLDSVLRHTAILHQLVHDMPTAEWHTNRIYHDLRGNAHTQPAWQMLLHCLNHSTQHRGQLITQMRALGLAEIPANDLVVFQRSLRKGG